MSHKFPYSARRQSIASRLRKLCLAVPAAAFLFAGLAAEPATAAPGLSEPQRQISAIAVPESDLRVDAWVNHADSEYAIGESLEVFVRTNADAYITIFNVDATGVVHMVFPNEFTRDNLIRANSVVQIPPADASFRLNVGGPAGANLLKVVASTENPSFADSIEFALSGGFRSFSGDTGSLARQITAVIDDGKEGDWAQEELTVAIVDQSASIMGSPSVIITQQGGTGAAPIATPSGASLLGDPASGFGVVMQLQGSRYREGDHLSLTIASEKECRLRLIDVDSLGNATMLFPNSMQTQDALSAGTVHFLPGTGSNVVYQVNGARGTHAVVAICTREEGDILSQLLGKARTSVAVLDSNSIADLAAQVNQLPQANVGRAVVTYEIVR